MRIDLRKLDEQVIVITGASSGIGLATAREAARRGARVMLASRDETDLRRAVDAIRAEGGEAGFVVGDVGDFDAMKHLAEAATREFGGFDTWVNNAGVSIYGRIEDVSLEDAERLFRTNYWGVVHGTLAALPYLKRTGGVLINVGSLLSEIGYPLQGHYAASKHAVKGFTDSLRLELEKDKEPVVVTLIEPAAIDTPYPEHAANYLATAPKQAPPVYDPQIVADAILSCAERPRRTLVVGGVAKMFTVMEKVAPGLADRFKVATAFDDQHSSEPPLDNDTLHAPRPGDGRIRGHYPGRVMKSSVLTAMARRRGTAAAALGVAALGIGLGLAVRAALADRAD